MSQVILGCCIIAQLVYDATNADLEEPDWGMFITLCDNVNQRYEIYFRVYVQR